MHGMDGMGCLGLDAWNGSTGMNDWDGMYWMEWMGRMHGMDEMGCLG